MKRLPMSKEQERLGWIVIGSAALVPLIVAACIMITKGPDGTSSGFGFLVMAISFVLGWPIAMLAIYIGARLLAKRIERGERSAIIMAIGSATIFGAIAVPFVENAFEVFNEPAASIAGAIGGLVSSACFCWLVRHWAADDSKRAIAPAALPDARSTSAHS